MSEMRLGWGYSTQTETGPGEDVETGGGQDGNREKGKSVKKTGLGMCWLEERQVWAGHSIVVLMGQAQSTGG